MLISGALENGAYGEQPARGVLSASLTGLAYAGFLLVLRPGGADLRRPAGPLFDATLVAAVVRVVAGLALGDADLVAELARARAGSSLLALSSQVLGWLLISVSLPRLPAALTSIILTIQPVGSVAARRRSCSARSRALLQLAGVALIVAGLVSIARRPGTATLDLGREPLRAPARRPGPRSQCTRSWRRFGRPCQSSTASGHER